MPATFNQGQGRQTHAIQHAARIIHDLDRADRFLRSVQLGNDQLDADRVRALQQACGQGVEPFQFAIGVLDLLEDLPVARRPPWRWFPPLVAGAAVATGAA